ncbi:hypothetical protein RKE25_15125 [Dyella sp. BiH032]|uniref:hypothetical protein n=1 Tax=Dyella sp. BiH032 TaxID=3075430 RepID=UPI0028929A64|nr:hypothetical protein [Dyella sp. BiH032]WNL44747.1 hypothetical protein RKE25_15125 [Dyella sp. BiH032]
MSGCWKWAGLVLVALVGLTGCQRTVSVLYRTEPGGATIESESGYIGRGLGERRYAISKAAWRSGQRCVSTETVTARWISGARMQQSENICLPDDQGTILPYTVIRVLHRPDGAPDLTLDLDYASEVAKQEVAKQQAAAQEAAARAEEANAEARWERAHARRLRAEAELERVRRDDD